MKKEKDYENQRIQLYNNYAFTFHCLCEFLPYLILYFTVYQRSVVHSKTASTVCLRSLVFWVSTEKVTRFLGLTIYYDIMTRHMGHSDK